MTSQSQSPQPQEKVVSEPQKPPSALTQLERARLILQSGKISFDPKLHLFNVLGSGDRPYVVRLFPRESCSCPSSGTCYHILAVKISIGSETNLTKHRTVNLNMLRKRTRARKDKTSGRKMSRKTDTDDNPAKRCKKGSLDASFDQNQAQNDKNKMSKRKKNSKKTTCRKQHQKHGSTPDTSLDNSTRLRFINAFKKSKKIMKGQNAQTDIPHLACSLPHQAHSLPHLVRTLPHLARSLPHLVRSLPHMARSLPHLVRSLPHLACSLPHLVRRLPHLARSLPHLARSLPHLALWFPTLPQVSHKVVQISYLVHDAQHHPKQW